MKLRIKAKYEDELLCVDTTNIPADLHAAVMREAKNYLTTNYNLGTFKSGFFEFDLKVVYKVIRDLKE